MSGRVPDLMAALEQSVNAAKAARAARAAVDRVCSDEDAAVAYEAHATFDDDALDWAWEHRTELPAEVLAVVRALYRRSTAYETVIDDVAHGARELP